MINQEVQGKIKAMEGPITELHALSESNRFRIVMMLYPKPLCVCELLKVLDISGATLSNHLKILRHAGLVDQKKKGRWIEYRLRSESLSPWLKSLIEESIDLDIVRQDRILLGSESEESCAVPL